MTDYYEKINEAVADAESRGWVRIPGQYNPTWRRSVDHPTPEFAIKNGWWTGATYTSHEFVAFILRDRDRAPSVVYETSRTHWTPKTGRKISFKQALEILASDTSDVHENHYTGTP